MTLLIRKVKHCFSRLIESYDKIFWTFPLNYTLGVAEAHLYRKNSLSSFIFIVNTQFLDEIQEHSLSCKILIQRFYSTLPFRFDPL